MTDLWTTLAARAAVPLADTQIAQLHRYLDLLIEANATMNLTRITDRPAAELLHIADALTLLPLLPAGPMKLADIGSGGGVPGIVLAIARPDAQVLLIESTKKKAAFLATAVQTLELKNVTVSGLRVEEICRGPERGRFDVVTARAVALLPWLVEWALPLLKLHGNLLAMKGARAAEELEQTKEVRRRLRAGDPIIHAIDLPGTDQHVVVQIPKAGRTEEAYPRSPSVTKGKHIQ